MARPSHRRIALARWPGKAGWARNTAQRHRVGKHLLARRLAAALAMIVLGIATASFVQAEPPKQSVPMNNWAEMRDAFVRCWTVPKGTEGSVISFWFLLAPNGALRGPPRVLAKVLKGDEIAQQRFVESAYATLHRCLPFNLTPSFKMKMGETRIVLRLVNTPREPARTLMSMISIFAEEVETE
jgi:hypothetical protein